MLIKVKGYKSGAREYLEEGRKAGRELSRDSLDKRVILSGDLALTEKIYTAMSNNGDRYYSVVLPFKESHVSQDVLQGVVDEVKRFVGAACRDDEFNFYAEAHLPKVRFETDKKTGEMIERRPHIHVIIPKQNLLTGNVAEFLGYPSEKSFPYTEALQEKLNRKFGLESPRDNLRVDNVTRAADIISRYKGDSFDGKNKAVKADIAKHLLDTGIRNWEEFREHLSSLGEVTERNKGKPGAYMAVKLPGDARFTNLKGPLFSRSFIENRALPPLSDKEIESRLNDWHTTRAREIKYTDTAAESFRKQYQSGDADTRTRLLNEREHTFYQGKNHDRHHHVLSPAFGPGDREHGAADHRSRIPPAVRNGLSGLPASQMDGVRRSAEMLLPADIQLPVGQRQTLIRRDELRRAVPEGGERRLNAVEPTKPPAFLRYAGIPDISLIERRSAQLHDQKTPSMASGRKDTSQAAQLLSERRATQQASAPDSRQLHEIKTRLHPERLLGWLRENHYAHPDKTWTVTRTADRQFRLRCGDRHLSYPDFLQREINMTPGESLYLLARLYASQQIALRAQRGQSAPGRFDVQDFRQRWLPERNRIISTEIRDIRADHRNELRVMKAERAQMRANLFTSRQLTPKERISRYIVYSFEEQKQEQQIRKHMQQDIRALQLCRSLPFSELKSGYIQHTHNPKESIMIPPRFMKNGQNTISSGELDEAVSTAEGFNQQMKMPHLMREAAAQRAQAGKIEALVQDKQLNDLYTIEKKDGAVKFLDKESEKLQFTQNEKFISVQKDAVSNGTVAIALMQAQKMYGSTLKITGSSEFKNEVVRAAADNNLEIRFTDKEMNRQLQELLAAKEQERPKAGTTTADSPAEANTVTESAAQTRKPGESVDVRLPAEDLQSRRQELAPELDKALTEVTEFYGIKREQFSSLDGEPVSLAEVSRSSEGEGLYKVWLGDELLSDPLRHVTTITVNDDQLKTLTGSNYASLVADDDGVRTVNLEKGIHLSSHDLKAELTPVNAEDAALRVSQATTRATTSADASPEDKASSVTLSAEAAAAVRRDIKEGAAPAEKGKPTKTDTSATETKVRSTAVSRDRDVSPENAVPGKQKALKSELEKMVNKNSRTLEKLDPVKDVKKRAGESADAAMGDKQNSRQRMK